MFQSIAAFLKGSNFKVPGHRAVKLGIPPARGVVGQTARRSPLSGRNIVKPAGATAAGVWGAKISTTDFPLRKFAAAVNLDKILYRTLQPAG